MLCDHNWTLRFLDVNDGDPFEVRPIEMSLKRSRVEYDFLRAKLPPEVGEEMKPHTRYENGKLFGLTPVEIVYNDFTVHKMLFRPDWVDYGDQFTYIQFHDLQKALADGTVDQEWASVKVKEAYETVVNAANNRLIDEIKFTVPGESEIMGADALSPNSFDVLTDHFRGFRTWFGKTLYHSKVENIESNQTKRLVDSYAAFDFEQISPEKALQRLNKKFRLKSWVTSDGTLIVGLPEANQVRHIAARRDKRVWRFKDPSISHGREPVRAVMVEGAWVDEPGIEYNPLNWFDEGGTNDVKAMGIARRGDIDYGSTFSVSSTKAKTDALPEVATLALRERMKEQNSGTIEIDPELSGTQVSHPLDVQPGDMLHVVPDDDTFENPTIDSGEVGDDTDKVGDECHDRVKNEAYLISEVQHTVTQGGSWQVHLDIGMYPEQEIESFMTYFDPKSDEWISDEEIDDETAELAGGWFESI